MSRKFGVLRARVWELCDTVMINCYPFISTLYKLGYVFVEVILLSHEYLTTKLHLNISLSDYMRSLKWTTGPLKMR